MFIEEKIENLEDKINKLISDNSHMTNQGYMTTSDVVKAVCKKLNIDIVEIDSTPTVKD